jgi:2-dehydropantoate 2-reductase
VARRRPNGRAAATSNVPPGWGVRILIYGAGVIGTLYGARLQQAGHEVVVLARSRRLRDIRACGLLLGNVATGSRETVRVECTDALLAYDVYDLVVVPVRRDQLASVLEPLAESRMAPTILFFGNNAQGTRVLTDRLGSARVTLGFPGAGGQFIEETVHYLLIPQQRTTIGEIDGRSSERLTRVASAFEGAGFHVAVSADMQSWLKTHAAFVACVAATVYAAQSDGRCYRRRQRSAAPHGASRPRGIPRVAPERLP